MDQTIKIFSKESLVFAPIPRDFIQRMCPRLYVAGAVLRALTRPGGPGQPVGSVGTVWKLDAIISDLSLINMETACLYLDRSSLLPGRQKFLVVDHGFPPG